MTHRRDKSNLRTRAEVHVQFRLRANEVFHFLVVEHDFRAGKRNYQATPGEREASMQFMKNDSVALAITCDGVEQSVALLVKFSDGWAARGFHRAMSIRCPGITIPSDPQTEDENALRQILVCYADALQQHFQDFLAGNVSDT